MYMPDDVATRILEEVQSHGTMHVTHVLGGDPTVQSVELVVTKARALQSLACVNRQFERLSCEVLRYVGRSLYRATSFVETETHFVYIRIQNA